VVLLHGSEVDHAFFKPWVSPLSSVAQLVYVDLIGHGRSDEGGPADWSITAWADSLADLCERLDLRRPVVFGSSLGGRIALAIAIRRPDLVGALVVVNSVLEGDPEHRFEIFRQLGGDDAAEVARVDSQHRSEETKREYMRLCMPLTVQRPYSSDELARLTPVSARVMDALVRISKQPTGLLPLVTAIECPTLVITGALDPMAPPKDAAVLAATIGTNATLKVIENAGHGVYRDQPQAFLDAVTSFLAAADVLAQNERT